MFGSLSELASERWLCVVETCRRRSPRARRVCAFFSLVRIAALFPGLIPSGGTSSAVRANMRITHVRGCALHRIELRQQTRVLFALE